ncbi:MAG: TetR family transcriptional regulator [Proteobacteria bacterium]|nr:TetR family transcriptional regulator [Pseudomonadota bacterium]
MPKPSATKKPAAKRPQKPPRRGVADAAQVASGKAARSRRTQARILDAAEELFSHHGIYGVSIRDIADAAGVDTALLHYHFANKDGIYEAVLLRRAGEINTARTRSLDDYALACAGKPSIEGVVRAYLQPVFERLRNGGRGFNNFAALIALANNTELWGGGTVKEYFDPSVQRLIELLRLAMPKAREADLYWGYQFLSGALTLSYSRNDRIKWLSHGQCRANDYAAIEPRLVEWCTAAFRALGARR